MGHFQGSCTTEMYTKTEGAEVINCCICILSDQYVCYVFKKK